MRWFFVLILMAFSILSCQSDRLPSETDITIEWEVVSNQISEQPAVRARFVIHNNSRFVLDESNWVLYFNQSPRQIMASETDRGAVVEHINGDWYRMVPSPGFLLEPGQKTEVVYEAGAWWIKESDAPSGLYFVFSDKNGKEKIVEVLSYSILPFERPEQIHRHLNDPTPIPNPELSFEENKKMVLLPEEEMLLVVPSPVSVQKSGEHILFDQALSVIYQAELESEALFLAKTMERATGGNISVEKGSEPAKGAVFLTLGDVSVAGKSKEAYRLRVNNDHSILIEGSDAAGVFYGMQSLLALFPVEDLLRQNPSLSLPVIEIEDAPRFGYRGLHVDVSRNFQSTNTIKKVMDAMAYYKLNVMHFHLTEDEGWRLEIPSLPELTAVGGQRGHTTMDAPALHPAYGSGPYPNAEGKFGSGYYTREEYIDLLKYARERHIKVIPEINLPGHARAAIKAMEARYEHYMALGDEKAANEFRLIDPEETSQYVSAQSFKDNVVNVARESAYHFLETVLDDVIDMYVEAGAPLDIVHIGGDEVPHGAWTQSPMIDQLMKQLPEIDQHANMHIYFTRKALEIFDARNLRMGGWEEVGMYRNEQGSHAVFQEFAGGQLIPYSWNSLWGAQDLAYRFANRGYPVVLCHVSNFYFDLAYNKDPKEPGLYWGGFVKTRDAWYYSPYYVFNAIVRNSMGAAVNTETAYAGMERIKADARHLILGLQAQMWSETILGPAMLEHYLLPKMIGFAESAWAPERKWETTSNADLRAAQAEESWNVFANTLGRRELPRLAWLAGGFNYRIPAPGAVLTDGMLYANVEFPGLVIRYTTDGSEPDAAANIYQSPVAVGAGHIKLRAYDASGRGSKTVMLRLEE